MNTTKKVLNVNELSHLENHMMNYTVAVNYFGCRTTMKVHIGLVGNHLDMMTRLVAEQFGNDATVVGATITGKPWKPVALF